MKDSAFLKMIQKVSEPDALEATVSYLAGNLEFLKKNERVLICFPGNVRCSTANLFAKAVERCGAIPISWEGDMRWKTLLRLAFSSRASTMIGPPLILLGLSKLARANNTPLNIRNAVTAGYPCARWMIEGIKKCLDCVIWGCYGPGMGPIVSAFTCEARQGFHLRDDEFSAQILDDAGNALPEGAVGRLRLTSKRDPSVSFYTEECARLESKPCSCGQRTHRLMDFELYGGEHSEQIALGQELLAWSSILDCRVQKGEYGLELELVIFPGEKLPKLPSRAKQIIRPWDPEKDVPFWYVPGWERVQFYINSY